MSAALNPGNPAPPNPYNLTPQNLRKWRAAKGRVRAGTGRAKLAIIGDSTTAGSGAAAAGGATAGGRALSYPTFLAKALNGAGLPAVAQNFWGDAAMQSAWAAYDPTINLGGAWTPQPTASPLYSSLGGYLIGDSATVGLLSWTPTQAVDTFVIYCVQNGSNGPIGITIDGAAPATGPSSVTTSGTGAVLSTTVTAASVGTHTLALGRSSSTVFVVGVYAYAGTMPAIDVQNMGWAGSKSADWVYSAYAWSPLPTLGTFAPDLTIINLGINEWNSGTPLATFAANMQTLITQAKLSGDCLVMIPVPSNPAGYASVATQQSYITQLYATASANSCPVLDITSRLVSYAAANAIPNNYSDGLHQRAQSYADIGAWAASLLLAV